jgi:hypothetical protein
VTYAPDRVYEEVASGAYYRNDARDAILDLEHPVRRRFIEEIGSINRQRED